jgi:transcriptional regulator with XRE-family HTH domain
MKQERIKKLRKMLGITQYQLAEIIGCSLPAVEHWERGYRNPGDLFEGRLEKLWKKASMLEKHNEKFQLEMAKAIRDDEED